MAQLPYDSSCQAEYEDGYIHDETTFNDISPYGPFEVIHDDGVIENVDKNILNDIIEKRPEAEHGKLVRFSVFYNNARHDVDWIGLPDNARPIRFRDKSRYINTDGSTGETGWHGCRFGYQYNDEDGKNHQEVQEL